METSLQSNNMTYYDLLEEIEDLIVGDEDIENFKWEFINGKDNVDNDDEAISECSWG